MARYPTLPFAVTTMELQEMYNQVQLWNSMLISELDSRDVEVDTKPTSNIYAVVTTGSIGRPRKGDIAYAASAGKFRGYVSTAASTEWQDLN
jgi:hypothetical protein